jgi:PAS domain S-box-containing protein
MPDQHEDQPGPPGEDHPDQTDAPQVQMLLRLLLEQGRQHALTLLDPLGRTVGWLAGAESVYGYRVEEMLGQPSARLFTPEDVALGLPEHELRVAREDGKAEDDRWMMRKDGARIWVSGLVTTLRDESGEIVGFGKIMRDVTDMKAHIDALESRAKAAAEADERKSVFMGALAHELANTFCSLEMGLHLTRQAVPALAASAASADATEAARVLSMMEHQIELTKRLLADLRDVTRIGQGRFLLERRRLSLNEALEQASAACGPLVDQRRQEFRLLLPPSRIVVKADPTRLNEVFVNLINNASKYTPEGGHIWVKMTTEGDEAVVKVEDSGVGIGPETLPRVFELFTQEEPSLERSQGGLGIGLWLVKNLVTLHGGTVGVRSEGKGKGSEFAVRLPITEAVPAQPDEHDEPDEPGGAGF